MGAIQFCRVKKLGYKVFAQAVSITSYSDRELLDLVDLVNDLEPYAMSLVDTYGLLHQDKPAALAFKLKLQLKTIDRDRLPLKTCARRSTCSFLQAPNFYFADIVRARARRRRTPADGRRANGRCMVDQTKCAPSCQKAG